MRVYATRVLACACVFDMAWLPDLQLGRVGKKGPASQVRTAWGRRRLQAPTGHTGARTHACVCRVEISTRARVWRARAIGVRRVGGSGGGRLPCKLEYTRAVTACTLARRRMCMARCV
jgi:hypothetical protein